MSDLHLETGQQYTSFHIEPHAPFLILAGDIGRLTDYDAFQGFLRTQCENFQKVFLVLGNHEFFGLPRAQGLALAEKLEKEDSLKHNLVVMNRKRVDLAGVTLLGCTLHSHVPEDAMAIVAQKINDFRRIGDWTVESHNAEHANDVEWLQKEITTIRQADRSKSKSALARNKILVVTHHAPAVRGTSAPANESNPWSSAFSTDLLGGGQRQGDDDDSPLDDVQCWVFGHTHHCSDFTLGKVRLVSNQRGYVFPSDGNSTATPDVDTGVDVGKNSSLMKTSKIFGHRKKVKLSFDPTKVIGV